MNANFWLGFEKQAKLGLIQKGTKKVISGGKYLASKGRTMAKDPNAGWISKNVGTGMKHVGNFLEKNPGFALGAGTALGAGGVYHGTKALLGGSNSGQSQNINMYR